MIASVGWAEKYQHVFTTKPSTGNSINLSGVTWNIQATNLGSYNSANYAGVQIGTKSADGSITLTSSGAWNYNNKTKITEVRLWLNLGGTSVTPTVTIGGKSATSDGTTVVKNSSAGSDWTKATKVTFTPATDGTGVVVINVATVKAGYICAMEIDCEEAGGSSLPIPVLSFSKTADEATLGESYAVLTLTNENSVPVTYSSSKEDVATVDASTGAVTLVGAGTTTITATFAGNDSFAANSASYTLTVVDPNAPGTQNNPYTVAQAINNTPTTGTSDNVYIKGIVSQFYGNNIMSDGANYRYYISDDGTTNNQLLVYKGNGLNNDAFSDADDLQIGDNVVIYGKLKKYSSIFEIEAGNYIVSLTRKKVPTLTFSEDQYSVVKNGNLTITATSSNSSGTITYASSNTDVAEIDATTGAITAKTAGTTTITATIAATDDYKSATATVELTVTAPKHTITFYQNGTKLSEEEVAEDAAITFPEATAKILGKSFIGWATAEIEGETNDKPSLVSSATMGENDLTYYAVYANVEGEEFTATLTEAEIKANFSNIIRRYADATKPSYEEDRIVWSASCNVDAAGRPWFQIKKEDDAYFKIASDLNISVIKLTITSATNSSGGVTDITKHTAFSGTVYLESEASGSPEGTLGSSNEISNNSVTLVPNSSVNDIYIQTSAAARIWGAEVTCGNATYSDYCTTIKLDVPIFSPAAGTVNAGTKVTITAEEGATIYYTTDETTPTAESTQYTEEITINETTTLKAIAVKDGLESEVNTVTYTVLQEATIIIHRYDGTVIEPTKSISCGSNMTFFISTNSSGEISLEDVPAGVTVSLSEIQGANSTIYNKQLVVNAMYGNNYSTPGEYPFKVVVAETETHTSTSVEFKLTINKFQTSFTSITGFEATKDMVNGTDGGTLSYVLNHNTNYWGDESYVTWSSSNEDIATIDNNGKITLVGVGEVTFTVSYAGNDYHTACSETTETMTVVDTTPVPVVSFSVPEGTYAEAQTVTLTTDVEGAKIYYTIDGSNPTAESTEYKGAITISETTTLKAIAINGTKTSALAAATYTIEIPVVVPSVPAPITEGFYTIKNNGNGQYVNVAGRRTVTFVDETATATAPGTVIKVKADENGQVQILRSQGVDIPGYAQKAMNYVPEIVQLVVEKLNNLDEDNNIMGENGMQALQDAFNAGFDYHLYTEQAEGGIRIYGKTPSMQPVVDFYANPANTENVDAKLPLLESFINKAIDKILEKTGGRGAGILKPNPDQPAFSLMMVWEKMVVKTPGLTEPNSDENVMKFYKEVLANEDLVWDFAYQMAMIYWSRIKESDTYKNNKDKLGEYANYIEKVENIQPNSKYYLVQNEGRLDVFNVSNIMITENDARTMWTLTERDDFKVTIPEDNELNGKFYTTFYADFAYTVPEDGSVKAYIVEEINEAGVAVKKEIEGTIPAQTPVLLVSSSTEAVLDLVVNDGTAIENELKGPDFLINECGIKTAQVEMLFDFAKEVLGEIGYENYVKKYEHLMARNAGTVNNKYFFGLDQTDMKNATNVRMLNLNDAGENLGFYSNWTILEANRAFIVDVNNPVKLFLKGDVDRDGDVDNDDVTALISIILGTDKEEDNFDYDAANVNEDVNGDINIADVTALVNILLP